MLTHFRTSLAALSPISLSWLRLSQARPTPSSNNFPWGHENSSLIFTDNVRQPTDGKGHRRNTAGKSFESGIGRLSCMEGTTKRSAAL